MSLSKPSRTIVVEPVQVPAEAPAPEEAPTAPPPPAEQTPAPA